MLKMQKKKILKDPRVQEEIDKHKWLESERAGYDIGYEKATDDWVKNFANEWEDRHCDKTFKKVRKVKRKIVKLFS